MRRHVSAPTHFRSSWNLTPLLVAATVLATAMQAHAAIDLFDDFSDAAGGSLIHTNIDGSTTNVFTSTLANDYDLFSSGSTIGTRRLISLEDNVTLGPDGTPGVWSFEVDQVASSGSFGATYYGDADGNGFSLPSWPTTVTTADLAETTIEFRYRAANLDNPSHTGLGYFFRAEPLTNSWNNRAGFGQITATENWQTFSTTFGEADNVGNFLNAVNAGERLKLTFSNSGSYQDGDALLIDDLRITVGADDWRSLANQRIEEYRKADLVVHVQDAQGRPVEGADVHVAMKNHDFNFGTMVSANFLQSEGEFDGQGNYVPRTANAKLYTENLRSLFNTAVTENAMKWYRYESHPDESREVVPWLLKEGLNVRGHALIWSGTNPLPQDVRDSLDDPTYVRDRAAAHVVEEATEFAGQVVEWDVLNEPIHVHVLEDAIGYDERVRWFQLARQADPGAKLFVNDYAILFWDDKVAEYVDVVQGMIDDGAPIDGIGMQGHAFWTNPPAPEELWGRMETLGSLGLDMAITEMDVHPDWTEEQQAEFLEMMLVTAFSHPQMNGVTMWGFWDGIDSRQNSIIFHDDWALKESGRKWIELIFDEWWTDEQGLTDVAGEMALRGFLGDYEVTVTADGHTVTQPLLLGADGTLLVTVPEPATWILLIMGLLCLTVSRRLRR